MNFFVEMTGFDGQPHAEKFNWETFHFTFTRQLSSFRFHPQGMNTLITTKKLLKNITTETFTSHRRKPS